MTGSTYFEWIVIIILALIWTPWVIPGYIIILIIKNALIRWDDQRRAERIARITKASFGSDHDSDSSGSSTGN